MGAFTFDYSLGREVEFYNRVDTDDPTNSAFLMVVLAAAGLEVDNTLRQYADLSLLLAASNNEVTNTNYARKTLTQADLRISDSVIVPNGSNIVVDYSAGWVNAT